MSASVVAKFANQLTQANVINYVDNNGVSFIFQVPTKTASEVFCGKAIYVDEETFVISILISDARGFEVCDAKFRVDGFIEALDEVKTLVANAYLNEQVDQKALSVQVKAVFESTLNVATVTDEVDDEVVDETATSSTPSGQSKNDQEIPSEAREYVESVKKVFEAAGFKVTELGSGLIRAETPVHTCPIHGNTLPIPVGKEDDPAKSKAEKMKDLQEDMKILSASMENLYQLMSICPYNETDALMKRITYSINILSVGSKDVLDRFSKLM